MRLTKKFRFDLREFHRTILRCLGPLSAVEECVAAFVENFDRFFDSGGSRVPEPEIASSSGRISGILILVLMSAMLATASKCFPPNFGDGISNGSGGPAWDG